MAPPLGHSAPSPARRRCTVVVLGDFGRSPRMQFHSLSLVQQAGMDVSVVAYGGSALLPPLAASPHVTLFLLEPPPPWVGRLPRALALLVKALLQAVQLLWALLVATPRPHVLLLQTPPCLPTFTACQLACLLRRSRLIIDWHNYAYSLMALALGPRSALVRAAEAYERACGRWASAHFTVSAAMAKDLGENWVRSWGGRGAFAATWEF